MKPQMIRIALIAGAMLVAALTLEAVELYHEFKEGCDLLQTAQSEAQMAEAWHLQAGFVLKRCGVKNAIEQANDKACYARRFNDTSEICN